MQYQIRKSIDAESVIRKCYPTDVDLINKYHAVAPTTEEIATKHTVQALQPLIDNQSLTLYEIYKQDDFVGYFGVEDLGYIKAITGMFVVPQYRYSLFMHKYLRMIKSKFNGTIYTTLYEKNTRAVKFLKRNGFRKIDEITVPIAPEWNEQAGIYKLN